MLHGRRFQACANISQERIACVTFGAINAHLDEFMRVEAAIDLGQHGFRQPLLADADDGMQAMRTGAQVAALGGSEFHVGDYGKGAGIVP